MDPDAVSVFLAFGSNMGDRAANLQRAVDLLADHGVTVRLSSRVYETDPVGGPPQPDYLNAVIEVETTLPPRALLEACLQIEREMGRTRGKRWGPRVIDVDVLTYGDDEIDEPGLQIPHPRMHERGFVLAPLLELSADPKLPGGRTMSRLRLGPVALAGVRPFAPALRTSRPRGG